MNHVLVVRSRTSSLALAGCSGARPHTMSTLTIDRPVRARITVSRMRSLCSFVPRHTPGRDSAAHTHTIGRASALTRSRARLGGLLPSHARALDACAHALDTCACAHALVGTLAHLARRLRRERRSAIRGRRRILCGEVDVAWNDERVDRRVDRGGTRVDRGDTRVDRRRLGPAHGAGAVAPATGRMWRSVSALWVQRA